MTLYRKLILVSFSCTGCLLIFVYVVQFGASLNNLRTQQEITQRYALQTLQVGLIPYLESEDRQGIYRTVYSVLQTGVFSNISLAYDGNQTQLELPSQPPNGAPLWFISLGLFPIYTSTHLLAADSLALGELTVISSSFSQYNQLWLNAKLLMGWFSGTFVVLIAMFWLIIHYALAPFESIKRRACAIIANDFSATNDNTVSAELQPIVTAINTMTTSLTRLWQMQINTTYELQKNLYQDKVSLLGNRKYFSTQLQAWTRARGIGGILLISVDVLEEIYRDEGKASGDELVLSIATILVTLMREHHNSVIARMATTEFGLLLPGIAEEQMRALGKKINTRISQLLINPVAAVPFISVIAGVTERAAESATELLTKADLTLQQAKQNGSGDVVIFKPETPIHLPKQECDLANQECNLTKKEWEKLIITASYEKELHLNLQPVLSPLGQLILEASSTQMGYEQQVFQASQLIAMVDLFKLGFSFDMQVFELIQPLLEQSRSVPIAVNVCASTLLDQHLRKRFLDYLQSKPKMIRNLILEIPEGVIIRLPRAISPLLKAFQNMGLAYGISQCTRNLKPLTYLQYMKPTFIKIDPSLTQDVFVDERDDALLRSLIQTAHQLNISVNAVGVETEVQLRRLLQMNIDGYQGGISNARFELTIKNMTESPK